MCMFGIYRGLLYKTEAYPYWGHQIPVTGVREFRTKCPSVTQ